MAMARLRRLAFAFGEPPTIAKQTIRLRKE
jgi:hypothetical protein